VGGLATLLPEVTLEIMDAEFICNGTLELFDVPPEFIPTGSSMPFDVKVNNDPNS